MQSKKNYLIVDGKTVEMVTSSQKTRRERNQKVIADYLTIRKDNPDVSLNKIVVYLSGKYDLSTVWCYRIIREYEERCKLNFG